MNLLILGPQGSGKGTQAQMLTDKFGFYHLEMGNILRSVSKSDNKYAKVVSETINNGNLVPDEYVRLIAWDHINQYHGKVKGFIFEGYPRSVAQYEHVEDMLRKFGDRLDKVILVNISEDESVKRLSSRLTCLKCGRVYNTVTAPPPSNGSCECGGELVQREDDKPEAIKRRLQIYRTQTAHIIERASEEGLLLEINGEQPIETIHQEIVAKLGL